MGALQSMVSWRAPRLWLATDDEATSNRVPVDGASGVAEAAMTSVSTDENDEPLTIGNLRREQLIDRIITVNKSATANFLDAFSTTELDEYYAHLECATKPRGRDARWVRPSRLPGISMSEPRD